MNPRGSAISVARRLAVTAGTALVWAWLNNVGSLFEVRPGLAFFFPAAAATLVAGAYLRWYGVAAVVAGTLLSPWGEAVGLTRGLLFSGSVGVWAAVLASFPAPDGSTWARLRRFVVLGVLGGSLVSALAGAALLTFFAGPRTWASYSMAVTFWWIPDLTAALCFGIPILLLLAPSLLLDGEDMTLWRQWSRDSRAVLAALALAATGGAAALAVASLLEAPVHWFVVLILPAAVVASLRGGVGSGVVANGLVSVVYVTLVLAGRSLSPDELIITLSSTYANMVLFFAFALLAGLLAGENRYLVEQVRRQGEALSHGLEETVEVLAAAIEARERGSQGHTERVARLAVLAGQELELPDEEVAILRRAAVLHDVGRLGTPDALLNKTATLEAAERTALARYVEKGVSMLERVEFLHPVLDLVRYRQERWDGRQDGPYPGLFDLRGDEIPLGSRIIAVAEAFDAMTHDRPYRRALGLHGAVAELWRCAGKQFDPRVVAAVTRIVSQKLDLTGEPSG